MQDATAAPTCHSVEKNPSTLLLFIHGLGGAAKSTWGDFPQLLQQDPVFCTQYKIDFFSYPTMLIRSLFSRRAPSIQDVAAALRTRIENRYAEFEKIVLICHSLGGLIGRYYILDEFKARRLSRVAGIVLFAVPNNGADLARVSAAISWHHLQALQLSKNSDLIELLNKDWFTMGLDRLVPAKYIAGTQDRVVDKFSAAARWGNPDFDTVVDKGHINIVKPTQADDDVVLILRRFLKQLANSPHGGIEPFAGKDATSSHNGSLLANKEDWEEELDVSQFHGRTEELAELRVHFTEARLLAITGRGGMGKSALLRKAALDVADTFDHLIWRSLKHARTLDELLASCLHLLPDEDQGVLPHLTSERLQLLLKQLKRKRCLLMLDNLEAIIASDKTAGRYRPGYENYREFFEAIGKTVHASCVAFTSREIPQEFVEMSSSGPVRIYNLKGIDIDAASKLLQAHGVTGPRNDIQRLVDLYGGNPQGIKLAANPIRKVFGNNIAKFLEDGEPIFGETERCLAWHFDRTSGNEKDILFWLAICGEPLSRDILQTKLSSIREFGRGALQEAVESLDQRSMIEISRYGFFLQGLVLEFVLTRLIEKTRDGILNGTPGILRTHALLVATARDPIRRMQERLILGPLIEAFGELNITELRDKLIQLLGVGRADGHTGFLAGNVVNILRASGGNLNALDFSGIPVWEAFLQGVEMRGANLVGADLAGSVFSETFGDILSVACSPTDGLVATGSTNGDIRLWSLSDYSLIHRFDGHRNEVWTLTFSPDGKLLASGGEDETIRFWDVTGRKQVGLLKDARGAVFALAFNSTGTKLAYAGDNHTAGVHDFISHTSIAVENHPGGVYSIAWLADGNCVATGGDDHVIRFWRITSRGGLELERELRGHSGWVRSLALSPGHEYLASGSYDRSIRLWSLGSGDCAKVFTGHKAWVRSVAFNAAGLLASGGDDGTVRVWNVRDERCTHVFEGHLNTVWSVSWDSSGHTIISGGNDQTIRYWDLATAEGTAVTKGFVNSIRTITFNPEGTILASGGGDSQVRLWNVESGRKSILSGHTDWIRSIAFSPDGKRLFSTGNDRTIRIWNIELLSCEEILSGHENWIYGVATADNRKLVTCSSDRTIRIWEWPGPTCRVFQHNDNEVAGCYSVAISPDGTLIASGGNDRFVRIREAGTLACRHVLHGHTNTVYSISFNGIGDLMASSGDTTVCVWDTRSGELIRTLQGHSDWVRAVRLSPDGRYAASGSDDSTVRLWDCATGACLWTGQEHSGIVWSVAFHPTNSIVASGSNDETVRLWDLNSGACLRVLRNERPYEGTRISGVKGVTEAQKQSLRALGAL